MLKIAVCDDDEQQRDDIHTILEQYITSHGIAARVWGFTDPKTLLLAVEENGVFDLYLLDVLMPEMDGIRLGLTLRKMDAAGLIIYLSTSRNFAVESYKAQAFHYLVKPITADALYPVLERSFLALQNTNTKVIRVKTREGMVHLLYDEIYYVELTKRIIRYVCKTRTVDSLYVRVPFSEAVAPLLRERNFFLCGSSFVVNLFHVTLVDKTGVVLSAGQRLELPKAACAALRIAWSDYWMGGL